MFNTKTQKYTTYHLDIENDNKILKCLVLDEKNYFCLLSDGQIVVFNREKESVTAKFTMKGQFFISVAFFSQESNQILLGSSNGDLVMVEVNADESSINLVSSESPSNYHQSGLTSIAIYHRKNSFHNEIFIPLSISKIIFTSGEDGHISIQKYDKISELKSAHNSQVSCIKIIENLLFSVGLDQRLNVYEIVCDKYSFFTLPYEDDPEDLKLLKSYITSVADLTRFDVIKVDENKYLVALAGHGIEILEIVLN